MEPMTLLKDEPECSAMYGDSKILQIFKLCLQPTTKEDLENILLNFRERIKGIQESKYFDAFDYVSIYVLYYVYKHDTAAFCSVSRTLYFYQKRNKLIITGEHLNSICNCDREFTFEKLQEFTNMYTDTQFEEILTDALLIAILNGNLALVLYLVKFGLVEIPSKVNEKCKKMFDTLVHVFNIFHVAATGNAQELPIQFNQLLNELKEKEVNIQKSLFIFCILTIVSEYKLFDERGKVNTLTVPAKRQKEMFLQKLECLRLCMQATTDLMVTFNEIENFTEVFMNPFLTAEIGTSFVDTARILLDDSFNYYNPRSLKDLARFKIRSNLKNSVSIPKQVNELQLPNTLKGFLNFHDEGFWELLVTHNINWSLDNLAIDETDN